ncbi:S-adenosyl-L-methionine-dependent methyltransferase [Coniochaeta sp. 2T2.1]|nr:S-adenosyl-L-methionine-dependent methyltransferase [Coniochaeta sp. 2T2.1]
MASTPLQFIAQDGELFLSSSNDLARLRVIAAAETLIREFENPGEQMAHIGWGEPSRTAALRTAFELGLMEKLGRKPMGSFELSEGTKADPDVVDESAEALCRNIETNPAARIMKHLVANGIVKEVGKDAYVGTPFSMATNNPTIGTGLIYSFEGMIPAFMGLPEFLTQPDYQTASNPAAGPVQYGLKTDRSFFEILQSNQRLGSAFNNFMTGYATARPRWIDFYPVKERLGGCTSHDVLLVDIGGGLGHETSALHKAHPELPGKLIVQDLEFVVSEARASKTLPDIVALQTHDFFTPQPVVGAKAYFMRLILHDWPHDKCETILKHLRKAMRKGCSRILINEAGLQDVGAPWQQTSLDWTMMAMLVSRERTESQWASLLSQAGLKITGIWSKEPESVIEAALADDEET